MSTKRAEKNKMINYEKLRELRQKLGFTQQQVADSIGVARHVYCRKERGLMAISLAEAYIISKKFYFSIEEIFFTE
jgi:DNA-binding XRE family transcriptional regulator